MPFGFALQRKIGEGAQGVVFLAVDKHSGKEVVVKQVTAYTKKQHQYIREEINFYQTLKHPFVLRQLGYVVEKDTYYYILQYAYYGDLSRYFYMYDKKIPEKNLFTICFQILLALDYIHAYNIIHRDIKPQNILVVKDAHFKAHRFLLSDFGVSRRLDENLASTCVGTAIFMAPEVVRGEKYSVLVDIWSLGVMMHYLATGEYLFHGADCYEVFRQILAFNFYEGNEILPSMSPYFNYLLKLMLSPAETRLSARDLLLKDCFRSRLYFCFDYQICDVSHLIPVYKIDIKDEFEGFLICNAEALDTEIELEPEETNSTDYYLRTALEANITRIKERICEILYRDEGEAFIYNVYSLKVRDEHAIDGFECSDELKQLAKDLFFNIIRFAHV